MGNGGSCEGNNRNRAGAEVGGTASRENFMRKVPSHHQIQSDGGGLLFRVRKAQAQYIQDHFVML